MNATRKLPPCGKPGTPERREYMRIYEKLYRTGKRKRKMTDHSKAVAFAWRCENRDKHNASSRRYWNNHRDRLIAKKRVEWERLVDNPDRHDEECRKAALRARKRGSVDATVPYMPKLKLRRQPSWMMGRPCPTFALPPSKSQRAYAMELAIERRGY